MKESYNHLEIEVIEFENEDVIITSPVVNETNGGIFVQ